MTACLVGRLLKGEVGCSNLTNNLIMGQVVHMMEGLGSVRCSAVSLDPTGRVVTILLFVEKHNEKDIAHGVTGDAICMQTSFLIFSRE